MRSLTVAMNDESKAVDAIDTSARTGRDGGMPGIDRAPRAAPVLEAAGFAGRQRRRQDHRFTLRTGVQAGQMPAHALIDPPPKADHRHRGEDGEYRPLQPSGGDPRRKIQETDDERGRPDEHQIKLRVDERQLRAQQYGADRDPRPPLHDLVPSL